MHVLVRRYCTFAASRASLHVLSHRSIISRASYLVHITKTTTQSSHKQTASKNTRSIQDLRRAKFSMDAAQAAFEAANGTSSHLVSGLKDMDWSSLPQGARDFIKNNPGFTGTQIIIAVIAFCPLLVASPLMLAAGFGPAGPIAGTWAAAFQAAYGTPAYFSLLQSAAMGGYGAALVTAAGLKAGMVASAAAVTGWWVKSKL